MTKQYVFKASSPAQDEDEVDTYDDPDGVVDEVQNILDSAQPGTILTITVLANE